MNAVELSDEEYAAAQGRLLREAAQTGAERRDRAQTLAAAQWHGLAMRDEDLIRSNEPTPNQGAIDVMTMPDAEFVVYRRRAIRGEL